MTRLPQKFVNPQNAAEYVWPVNHSEENEAGVARQITTSANTGNDALVMQQGDEQPLVFQISGTIFARSQVEAFREWYLLCRHQTIDWHKYTGDIYSVLITSFKPKEQRVVHNPKDSTNAPLWIWKYQMELTVVAVKSGVWVGIVQ
jgi:hypothetical protein